MTSSVIAFLSDYGLSDPFVGVCHAVIARLAPSVRVIDLTHGVPAQDVLAGAVMLADSIPYVPPGVTLAVVDPGVGTSRRAVAIDAGRHWFVGPDNGVFSLALDAVGGPQRAWQLKEQGGISATFHGRDVFAPAAARLAACADPSSLGEEIDPGGLHRLVLPDPEVGPGRLRARILTIDGFGNVALGAGAPQLRAAGLRPGDSVTVQAADVKAAATVGRTFADVGPGDLVVLLDSAGRVSCAVNGGDAAGLLHTGRGTDLVLTAEMPERPR